METRPMARSGEDYGDNLKGLFLLEEGFVNMNHGSFGTVPRLIVEKQFSLMLEAESKPDYWFRTRYYEYVDISRTAVAKLINASPDDVILLENASSAINGIFRSSPLKRGDKVLRLSTAYNMCIQVLNWLESTLGIEQVVVDVRFPYKTDHSELLSDVSKAFAQHGSSIKMALLSHISSMPTIIEPVKELTKICKQGGSECIVIVDGAHAPGAINIDVEDIGCDYYTGNLHKWTFCPKGCAFLHTARGSGGQQEVHGVQPLVISSSGKQGYLDRFAYTGTRDYTAFACIPAAFAFVENSLGGFAKMSARNHELLVKGCEAVARVWGTSTLLATSPSPSASVSASVSLPVGVMMDVVAPAAAQNEEEMLRVQTKLSNDKSFNTFFVYGKVPVMTTFGQEQEQEQEREREREREQGLVVTWFVRLSAQVYLEEQQYTDFALNFLHVLNDKP